MNDDVLYGAVFSTIGTLLLMPLILNWPIHLLNGALAFVGGIFWMITIAGVVAD